jgi:hypothetical protein
MNYVKFIFSTMVLAALLFSGCKKTDTTTGPTNTTPSQASGNYTGVLAGNTSSGAMTLNIPSSSSSFAKAEGAEAVVTVTGTVVVGSDSLSVTGTYNTSNDSLYVNGSLNGETFSFAGTFNTSNNSLSGTWSDSNGDSGNFTTTSGSTSSVKLYLGAAVSTTHSGTTAILNMVVSGNNILGVATLDGQKQFFTGTVSNGTSITLYASAAGLSVNIGSGTFTTGDATASGSYNLEGLDSGNWSATLLN